MQTNGEALLHVSFCTLLLPHCPTPGAGRRAPLLHARSPAAATYAEHATHALGCIGGCAALRDARSYAA